METASVYKNLRLGWRDGAWLTIALILHGSLFFIPLKQFHSEQNRPQVLSLALVVPPVSKPVAEVTRDLAPSTEIAEPDTNEEVLAEAPPPEAPQAVPELPQTPVTAAQLVEAASRFKWSIPEKLERRQLGVPQPQEVPPNWRPGIRLDDNLFDGMTVPEKTEVVDEWLGADGARNVVINTSSGETLCGRKQAWDPLNPMMEHLMMFRTCGSSGKRPFKMPDRFKKHLVD